MIETKEQLLASFSDKAQAFLDNPGLVSGIDFDDAVVTLKRYVLSELHDQELGSKLALFPKLIRQLDVRTLAGLIADIQARLASPAT